jgi:hypothetical protein
MFLIVTLCVGVGGPLVEGRIREITLQELRKHKKRQATLHLSHTFSSFLPLLDFSLLSFSSFLPLLDSVFPSLSLCFSLCSQTFKKK